MPSLPSGIFPLYFPTKNLTFLMHATCPAHVIILITYGTAQNMKLLNVQFFPSSCYFYFYVHIFSTAHCSVTSQSIVFPLWWKTMTPHPQNK